MADKNLSGPIPDGWSLEIKKKKDGSKVLVIKHLINIFVIATM